MLSNEQKHLARARRERKFRRRLATLSWTFPVVAFGSLFSIWYNISSTVSAHVISKPSRSVVSNTVKANRAIPTHSTTITRPALFKIGSRGSQVSVIQGQLQELGYFNHVITEYYGTVTEQAVEAFQSAQHLTKIGEIDSATLNALQQAVKNHHMSSLVRQDTGVVSNPAPLAQQSVQSTSTVVSNSQTTSQTSVSTTSSVAVSQQSIPQTSTSGS